MRSRACGGLPRKHEDHEDERGVRRLMCRSATPPNHLRTQTLAVLSSSSLKLSLCVLRVLRAFVVEKCAITEESLVTPTRDAPARDAAGRARSGFGTHRA